MSLSFTCLPAYLPTSAAYLHQSKAITMLSSTKGVGKVAVTRPLTALLPRAQPGVIRLQQLQAAAKRASAQVDAQPASRAWHQAGFLGLTAAAAVSLALVAGAGACDGGGKCMRLSLLTVTAQWVFRGPFTVCHKRGESQS